MPATEKALLQLTARDLMTTPVMVLPHDLSLRDAARRLLRDHISGAPVVDAAGRCTGVLSTADFLRLLVKREEVFHDRPAELPATCSFQEKRGFSEGREVVRCTLTDGSCPFQRHQKDPAGEEIIACIEPHCVLADWQVVRVESLPTETVGKLMTADPVTASPDTPIRTLARSMIDAHIHRVVVVDDDRKPVGLVSAIDLLAALAYAEDE